MGPDRDSPLQRADDAPAAIPSLYGKRVLVVEDQPPLRKLMLLSLRRYGVEVLEAPDAATALSLAASNRLDAALLDVGLPGELDGLQLCVELRRMDGDRLAILVVSARGQPADLAAGRVCGADDYIVKPFGLRDLALRVDAALRTKSSKYPGEAFSQA